MRSRRIATIIELSIATIRIDAEANERIGEKQTAVGQAIRDEERGHGAEHEHVAVGEVDHEQHAVDQRVAECDEGVEAALGDAEDHQAAPLVALETAGREGRPRPDRDTDDDGDPQSPEDVVDEREAPEATHEPSVSSWPDSVRAGERIALLTRPRATRRVALYALSYSALSRVV